MRFALDAMALGWPSPSGIRTVLLELVPALARLLDGDTLLLWQNDRQAARRPLGIATAPGIDRRSCRLPPRALELLWRRMDWPTIETFAGPLDVFHSPQGRLPPARRARLVLSLNDFRHRRLPHLYPGARWHPREIARADHFIAISETTRRDAAEFLYLPPERITTIHLGPPRRPLVDPRRIEEARRRWGLEGPFVFCPSAADPRKNAAGAVEAFARLRARLGPPHRLAVVGSVPPEQEEGMRRTGGESAVFTGLVDDLDYHALLSSAELAVLPSLNEGFGFPVLEAFQADVPLAVAGNSALPEIAGPAALTFDPCEPEMIAAALARLITEPELREALAAAGRRRLAEFSWERTARETLSLYRTLGGRERRPVFRRAPAGIR